MLHSAKLYDHALDSAAYGVTAESVRVDHAAVIARKERVIKTLVGGVCAAMKASGVTTVNGRAVITGKDPAGYSVKANGDRYVGKNLIIATGSESVLPPIEGLRESLNSGFAVTNRELLFSCEAPKRLVVVGGGVIGLEMASYYQMTGTAVTVVEMMDHIAGPCDKDLVKLLQKNYERGGMRFELNACVKVIGNSRVLCQRGGETFDVTVTRATIEVEVVRAELLDGNVGYLKINNFDSGCAEKSIAAIESLREQGATSLLFDVRFNPGGHKDELVELLDYLLPEGPLFRSVDYKGNEDIDYSDASCVELPMAVLVNGDSYSAAEFFAAALQEYGVGTVVGTQTVGKANYQQTFVLSDGSAVAVSTGHYQTPHGVTLAGVGITPDIPVEVDDDTYLKIYSNALEKSEDAQLQAAIAALTQGNP